MTSLEEAREMVKNMLSEALEGRMHENTENYLNQISRDYEEVYEKQGDTGTEWKRKYDDLKEKYITRFTSPPVETRQETEGNITDEQEEIHEDASVELEDITIDDLFES